MRAKLKRRLALIHILPLVLAGIVLFAPKQRSGVAESWALLAAMAVIELLFVYFLRRRQRKGTNASGLCDIISFVWLLLIAWEIFTSVTGAAHPVLVPEPENVFDTFREQWDVLALNILYSLQLLVTGFAIGMAAAIACGLAAGWYGRLRDFVYPIANVLAPIPPVVFSPYLVAIMPSFRSASAAVIVLGVFWPALLTTINRVAGMDRRILDSAKMLDLGDGTMLFRVLLPYILPGIISGLRVSVTTSLLMLNFAELMGATHGMGYYIQNSITYANYTHAVAGIVCIGLVVTVLNALVGKVQARAVKWRE